MAAPDSKARVYQEGWNLNGVERDSYVTASEPLLLISEKQVVQGDQCVDLTSGQKQKLELELERSRMLAGIKVNKEPILGSLAQGCK